MEGSYKAYAAFWSKNKDNSEFRKKFKELKIRSSAGFTIDNTFYTEYYQETISKDALNAYIQCINSQTETGEDLPGGFYYDIAGDLLSGFTLIIKKEPESGQIEKAKIISVTTNNLDFYDSYNLRANATIRSFTGISQNMKVKNPNIPATITLNIEGFDPMVIKFPAYPYANFPVGSIIISTLDFNEFSNETKNHMPYSADLSKWAPADGRDVKKSDYGKLYNPYTPDLRGQFLRGKNQFYSAGEPSNYLNGNDKGQRVEKYNYSYQKDATKIPNNDFKFDVSSNGNHNHTMSNNGNEGNGWGTGDGNANVIGTATTSTNGNHNHTVTLDSKSGDIETRPQNIAVFYYIRINK